MPRTRLAPLDSHSVLLSPVHRRTQFVRRVVLRMLDPEDSRSRSHGTPQWSPIVPSRHASNRPLATFAYAGVCLPGKSIGTTGPVNIRHPRIASTAFQATREWHAKPIEIIRIVS